MLMVDLIDCSVFHKIRQILLHWCYEFVESEFVCLLFFFSATSFVHVKMRYYEFNRRELLEKAKDRYHNRGG